MNDAKLSDFSSKELSLLQIAVQEKLTTCANNLLTLSKFDDGEFKSEQQAYWFKQFDTYQLWQTQIMNAAVEVKKKELAYLN